MDLDCIPRKDFHGILCRMPKAELHIPTLSAHNIGTLLAAGIVATINSDDPAYFGGYLSENYTAMPGL